MHSKECFDASKSLLRRKLVKNTFEYYYFQHLSGFPIRQAIEIRIKDALGIDFISESNGATIPIVAQEFIDLFRDNRCNFPVKISYVNKINSWSQYFIHAGFSTYIWQIEWAHYILQPLFNPYRDEFGYNMYGTVSYTKSFASEIEKKVKEITSKKSGIDYNDIIIHFKNPAARIVEDPSGNQY